MMYNIEDEFLFLDLKWSFVMMFEAAVVPVATVASVAPHVAYLHHLVINTRFNLKQRWDLNISYVTREHLFKKHG